ncbi:uncharacterized protein [Macrobrachium rosenbergii]
MGYREERRLMSLMMLTVAPSSYCSRHSRLRLTRPRSSLLQSTQRENSSSWRSSVHLHSITVIGCVAAAPEGERGLQEQHLLREAVLPADKEQLWQSTNTIFPADESSFGSRQIQFCQPTGAALAVDKYSFASRQE